MRPGLDCALVVVAFLALTVEFAASQSNMMKPTNWADSKEEEKRKQLGQWLIKGCWKVSDIDTTCDAIKTEHSEIEYPGYDGFYNNLAHPDLGAIDTPLLRRVPAAYEDGVYRPSGSKRPNPIELSDELMAGEIGTMSKVGRNALLVFFGQQVVEEVLDAQRGACPPEYFNIKVPDGHRYQTKPGHTELPLLRTRFDARTGFSPNNPRQQLNEITPWLDGGLTYGSTKSWSDQLRTYSNGQLDPNGLLASSENGKFPEYNAIRLPMANPAPPANHSQYIKAHELAKVSRFFKLGNPRGNENPFLLSFGVLWFRWHNYLAKELKANNNDWSGEKIYNEARKWVIASHQHIVVNEWLPKWLGSALPDYTVYNPSIDPQIDQFFQSAAMRFGHTLVPPGIYLRDYGRDNCRIDFYNGEDKAGTVRTCNSFWRPQETIQRSIGSNKIMDIDRLLMGMGVQLCEKEDHTIVEDLRGNVFGPLEFSRRDLMAVNIQRGRDHGLPDFNTAREAYNLDKYTDFQNFSYISQETRDKLMRLYNNSLSDIDVWVGGLLETTTVGPGELFTAIIRDQFQRIRDGDRFWYKNRQNKLFKTDEIERLESLTLYDIIMSVTEMDSNDLQPDVFRVPTTPSEIHVNCRVHLLSGACSDENNTAIPCHHLPQLDKNRVNACVDPGTYDYFSNSEGSFIATFVAVGVVIFSIVGGLQIAIMLQHKQNLQKQQRIDKKVRETFHIDRGNQLPFSAQEWVGKDQPLRPVVILLHAVKKQIHVCNQRGILERAMDVAHTEKMHIFTITDGLHVLLRISNDYDLVLKFDSEFLRTSFIQGLEDFVTTVGVARERVNSMTLGPALRQAVTRKDRQKRLEMFFRTVFSQAFNISNPKKDILKLDVLQAKEIIYTELTSLEFAEALSMRADSEFVKKMFSLVDKDKNGFISFREFVDMLVIFAKGSADDKAKLMFDMYDINGTGQLTREDFTNMIKSFMETVGADVEQKDLESVVNHMLLAAGLSNKDALDLNDFQRLLLDYKDKLNYAELSFGGIPLANQPKAEKPSGHGNRAQSFIETARTTATLMYAEGPHIERENVSQDQTIDKDQEQELKTVPHSEPERRFYHSIQRYVQNSALDLFWISLYTLILLAIFAERSYYYSVEREHSGLRRIAGYGVTVTRGAASAMMFTYSSLLVTMCQNTITVLRDTFLHMYFPFDSSVFMHKYIALWALFFTIMHVVGHACNFYSISTQTSDDLTCLFRNFFHGTHEIPKFHYWCWQTITGFTGVLLTILAALMFAFAMPYARQKLYNGFWFTHSLYPIFYILMILHGSGRLIQPPFTYYFLLGPAILFALDRVVSLSRKKVEIPVLKAELLPSNVLFLVFPKPSNFEYKSGQWVRIACLGLSPSEFHPFTISSAPHEKNLTLHIRAVGPWTTNIRQLYDPSFLQDNSLPKIHLDGPYGEGHQDWYQYDVAVLVGGGIGVTPFASILKDIVFRKNLRQETTCKKVYFIWVTKTQKHFEWLVDIIRDVEKEDEKSIVSVHIYITQFYQKFDLRTILLYICERHFQKVSSRSLFTGLKAQTHFGRPNFNKFFESLCSIHPKANKVGVFSCGPAPMTQSVEKDCAKINQEIQEGPIFQHHFKNF